MSYDQSTFRLCMLLELLESNNMFKPDIASMMNTRLFVSIYRHTTYYACHPSPAFRTNIRALFTKARIRSSNALRSCSGALGSPRLSAVERRSAGLEISISSSCRTSGYFGWLRGGSMYRYE